MFPPLSPIIAGIPLIPRHRNKAITLVVHGGKNIQFINKKNNFNNLLVSFPGKKFECYKPFAFLCRHYGNIRNMSYKFVVTTTWTAKG